MVFQANSLVQRKFTFNKQEANKRAQLRDSLLQPNFKMFSWQNLASQWHKSMEYI